MITESEFLLARNCPVKILHERARLPRTDRTDSFSEWMQKESQKVRALSRLLFSATRSAPVVGGEIHSSVLVELEQGRTVTEVRFEADGLACTGDFVVISGHELRLYTVAAKAVDPARHRVGAEFTTQRGANRADWVETLDRMAFRVLVTQACLPNYRVIPFLVAPCSGATAEIEGLPALVDRLTAGDSEAEALLAAEADRLLAVVDVKAECLQRLAQVRKQIAEIRAFLDAPTPPRIGYKCRSCPFRTEGPGSGFARCGWGPHPTILDVGYVYFVQTEDRRPIIDTLAPIGRVSALDLPRDRILGEHAGRIIRQLDCLESGKEIINPALELEMQHVSFPVHFLDIETIRTSVPVHRGGRVNGLTLFQFSVHTRQFMRGPLVHHAWLNTETADPNRTFLRALRAVLGDFGTVLIWTEYERQCFHELLNELLTVGAPDADTAWLQALLFGDRMFDQHRLCYDYYQHPLMGGRTSIKAVLPAVWSEDSPVKLMAPYVDFAQDIDPYAALHQAGNVSDGCNAMEAYLALMAADIETRQTVENGLLKYCHVDTAAMAFVWDYWESSLLRQRLHSQKAGKTVPLG